MRAPMLQPAIVGGVAAAVLSVLPIVNLGNLCCCLWVVSGGVVAAYLLQQNQPAPLTASDGALVGLLAGIAGAILTVVLSIPISWVMGPVERDLIERVARQTGQELPAALEGPMGVVVYLAFGCAMLFVGAVFSTLGGLLGVALFRKPAPPGVIDIPPQA
jgi:hypothetical protein